MKWCFLRSSLFFFFLSYKWMNLGGSFHIVELQNFTMESLFSVAWRNWGWENVLGLVETQKPLKGTKHDGHTGSIKEKLKVAFLVSKAAVRFVQGSKVGEAASSVSADDLASIVEGQDMKSLNFHGGVYGIAKNLSTNFSTGLYMDHEAIKERQKVYGINKFEECVAPTFWVFLWDSFSDVTLRILGFCALASLIIGIVTEGWPKGAHDGLGIVASILLVVFVTATSDYRQLLQFRELDNEKKKIYVQVTRNGYRQRMCVYELLPGDIVHLGVGDQVPADGLFISGSGSSLNIDESSLTGESELVMVNEELPFLLSGTKVKDGSCKMVVTTVGMRTRWGKLMATLSEEVQDETPLQGKLRKVATTIGKIGLCFAFLTFAVLIEKMVVDKWQAGTTLIWSGEDGLRLLEYFAIAVTIVVVAVPEGLPLAVTLSLAFAMKRMMNDKALVRQLAACETMGSATTICSDKTGTLTTNHMTVVKSCIGVKELHHPINSDSTDFDLPASLVRILFQSIFSNTSGEVVITGEGKHEILGTPTETALLEFCLSLGGDFHAERRAYKLVKVEPFNSTKKRMGVVLELPGGELKAHTKGASEIILASCDKVIDSNGRVVPLTDDYRSYLDSTIEKFANEALRTLCLAYKELDQGFYTDEAIPTSGYTCIAIVGIKDPVRPGVRESIALCRSAGVTVRMVTGDNINTAKAIARECGILTEDGIAIEGSVFREKSLREMIELIPKIQVMARSLPLDKHTLVKHLRTTFNEVVAVTGDGTNDAPALHEADIGLAMGIAGTEVAKESADVIILDDNFSTIVNVAKWGRSVYINIQNFVQFQLTVNIVALMVNFSSACLSGKAPLTAVQLLWVNMIMDTLGALALATEPPKDKQMKKPPIGRNESFITSIMWRNILGQCLYQFFIISILQAYGSTILGLDTHPDPDLLLNTILFNTFVFCQVFNEVNSREMEKVNVFKGIFQNRTFMVILGSTVVFQIVIVEFLGSFANTTPLNLLQWCLCLFIGFLGMPVAALLKLIPLQN